MPKVLASPALIQRLVSHLLASQSITARVKIVHHAGVPSPPRLIPRRSGGAVSFGRYLHEQHL